MNLKKLFLFLWFTSAIVWGSSINAIALVVEGEPITTHEISKLQKRAHISKQQAIDLLIQDRLQKSAMQGIVIDDAEVESEIAKIASLNHISVEKMQQILKQQGTPWKQYKNSIRTMMKQRRFFQQELAQTLPEPTESELKQLYQKEKKHFTIPSQIVTTEYTASSKTMLNNLRKHLSYTNIQYKKKVFDTKTLNSGLLDILLNTPKNQFTQPINNGNNWVMYRVWSQKGKREMSFEEAYSAVDSIWRRDQQEAALKDYFQKQRTKADIRYLRK